MKAKERICLALDVDTIEEAENFVRRLSPWVGVFKVGSHLFSSGKGAKIINSIQATGADVFLDLKYHDIPNTVANAARIATNMGILMFNVHALGGSQMMQMVAEAVHEEAAKNNLRKPIALAITILTSMSQEDLKKDLLIDISLKDYVNHLALLTKKSGLDGIVCSPKEISLIRNTCGDDFKIVTPGIRPSWIVNKDDQKRITNPKEAIINGADYIVIGRPVLTANSPEKAAEKILTEISQST